MLKKYRFKAACKDIWKKIKTQFPSNTKTAELILHSALQSKRKAAAQRPGETEMSPSTALTKKALYDAAQRCTFQQCKPGECDTESCNTSVGILKTLNLIMTINYPNPVWCRWSLALMLKSAGKVLQSGCRSHFYLSWSRIRKSGDCLSL